MRDALDTREQNMRDGRGSANEWRRMRGYPLMLDITATTFADHIKPMTLLSLNLNTVRELMGHGDIKMTLRYAYLAPEHKAAAKLTAPQSGNVTTLDARHADA